jgi:hypothetical protein
MSRCVSGKAIIAYMIALRDRFLNYDMAVGPLIEKIEIGRFFRDADIFIVDRAELIYTNNQWHIRNRPLREYEGLIMFSCFTEDNKFTVLSENALLVVKKSKKDDK